MTRIISVQPFGDGWSVQSDAFDSEMMFLSGAKAEAAARRLAEKLARGGQTAEVRIYMRGGELAGSFVKTGRPHGRPAAA